MTKKIRCPSTCADYITDDNKQRYLHTKIKMCADNTIQTIHQTTMSFRQRCHLARIAQTRLFIKQVSPPDNRAHSAQKQQSYRWKHTKLNDHKSTITRSLCFNILLSHECLRQSPQLHSLRRSITC